MEPRAQPQEPAAAGQSAFVIVPLAVDGDFETPEDRRRRIYRHSLKCLKKVPLSVVLQRYFRRIYRHSLKCLKKVPLKNNTQKVPRFMDLRLPHGRNTKNLTTAERSDLFDERYMDFERRWKRIIRSDIEEVINNDKGETDSGKRKRDGDKDVDVPSNTPKRQRFTDIATPLSTGHYHYLSPYNSSMKKCQPGTVDEEMVRLARKRPVPDDGESVEKRRRL